MEWESHTGLTDLNNCSNEEETFFFYPIHRSRFTLLTQVVFNIRIHTHTVTVLPDLEKQK